MECSLRYFPHKSKMIENQKQFCEIAQCLLLQKIVTQTDSRKATQFLQFVGHPHRGDQPTAAGFGIIGIFDFLQIKRRLTGCWQYWSRNFPVRVLITPQSCRPLALGSPMSHSRYIFSLLPSTHRWVIRDGSNNRNPIQ